MKSLFNRFIRSLLIFTTLLIGIGVVLQMTLPSIMNPYWVLLILFFWAVTATIFYIMQRAKQKNATQFINSFMIISLSKLFLLVALIGIYAFLQRATVINFTITVLLLFVSHLVFELYWLIKLNKTKEEK